MRGELGTSVTTQTTRFQRTNLQCTKNGFTLDFLAVVFTALIDALQERQLPLGIVGDCGRIKGAEDFVAMLADHVKLEYVI